MAIKRHGLSVGLERTNSDFFITVKAIGKLTHDDYLAITPMLEDALKGIDKPQIHALMDLTEFEGWELRAAWDDFRLGLRHGSAFARLAIVGEKSWQEKLSTVANWFMPGEVAYFESMDEALDWLDS